MKLINSLLQTLFSKLLDFEERIQIAFAITEKNEYLPSALQSSDVVLFKCRKGDEVVVYEISGLFISNEQKYAISYELTSTESLPLPEEIANISSVIVPDSNWNLKSFENAKTYFIYNSCLWTQNTVINNRLSYIVQQIKNNSQKLLFSMGFINSYTQENRIYNKRQVCQSICNFIKSN